jgi:N-succinyldiaminopimelate aminotransferase
VRRIIVSSDPNPRISNRVSGLTATGLARLLNEGHESGALDLALGTPSAPATSPALVDAAHRALDDGVHQYEALDGKIQLREWIATTFCTPADPRTELTVTNGATEALFAALMAVSNPGQEVVIFEPVFENFINVALLCGCVPKVVRLHPPKWTYNKTDLEAAVGPNTCAVVICTPNNPTGHMSTAEELEHLAKLCARWNCAVIADEVYSQFTFDERRHISVADMPQLRNRSLVVGSFSKSHAVTGWRVGYLRAPAPLTAAARKIHTAVTAGTTAPLQAAFARAGAMVKGFVTPRDTLRAQRDRLIQMFAEVGLRCFAPDGGCYFMADLDKLPYQDADAFAQHLLEDARIMIAPGRFFFSGSGDAGRRLVRVAFNRRQSFLDEIERRLHTFVPRSRSSKAIVQTSAWFGVNRLLQSLRHV